MTDPWFEWQRRLAITAIAEIAATGLAARIATRGAGEVDPVAAARAELETSIYWPAFREAVAAGDVRDDFVQPWPLALAVKGWAMGEAA